MSLIVESASCWYHWLAGVHRVVRVTTLIWAFDKTEKCKIFFFQPYALLLLLLRLNNIFMETFHFKPVAAHWSMGESGQER